MSADNVKKRSYKSLELSTKVEIIEKVEAGSKQVKMCEDYGLNKQTVSNIIANKQKIREAYEKNTVSSGRKRIRLAKHDDLDQALSKWYTQMRARNIPITGPLLMEKAKMFADMLKIEDFKASTGWLDHFKKRHGLSFKVISGEMNSVSDETVQRWTQEQLPKLLEGWQPRDVFNCDESGLFYKMLPNKTLAKKGALLPWYEEE